MTDLDRSAAGVPASFARHGYAVLPGLIDRSLASFLWSYAHTRFASRMLGSGDRQVPGSPGAYGDPAFDGLLEHLRPEIEKWSGFALLPTYSYFRIYKRGDILARHRDRPACEISVSVNVGQDAAEPWPLHIEGKSGAFAATLSPGDGLLYRGMDHDHWRDRFEGHRLVQVFLHYVDRHGPHAARKFDERPTLMVQRTHSLEDASP